MRYTSLDIIRQGPRGSPGRAVRGNNEEQTMPEEIRLWRVGDRWQAQAQPQRPPLPQRCRRVDSDGSDTIHG
jgi:hypothetical protein